MSEGNKAIVRRWLEELDQHNFDIIDEVVSPDLRFHFPGNPTPMTFEEYKQFVLGVYQAWPDLRHKIDDLIAEGDSVVMRATDTGTHKGEFMGVAPTGRKATLSAIAIFRFVKGKCVEAWEELDLLGLMRQLGAVPPLGKE